MRGTTRFALALISGSLLVAACSGAPKPPPCETCAPWTPAPIPQPVTSGSASASVSAPVSQAAPPPIYTIEQLLKVRRSNTPRAIDDDAFLYLYDVSGTAQLHVADKAGAPPKQLTSYADRVSSLRVAPGAKQAVFLKDQGGDENDQIYRIDLPSGQPVALTNDPKTKHTLPSFDANAKRIVYTSNARNGKDMDLYLRPFPGEAFKEGQKADKPAMELPGNWMVSDVQGDRVLAIEARSNVDQDVWILDLKTKKKTLLTKHEGDERWENPRFSRDARSVFALTDAGREFVGLVAVDVATTAKTAILSEEHDVVGLAMPRWAGPAKKGDPADVAVVALNVDGIETLLVLTLDGKRKIEKRVDTKVSGVIGTVDVSPTGKSAFVAFETSTRPAEVYRLDLATGEAKRATSSDHAGIDESKLIGDRLMSFESSDKKKISYFVWGDAAGAKQPAIIEIHGGPEAQAQPWFSGVRQFLALAGYVVVAPNVRGSIGYGKSFAHLDDKDKREDSVRDLSELGKHLGALPEIDAKRIALYGGSYGGYMVLAGLTLYPDQWAAGVDIVGIANFRTFLEQTKPYRRALREAEYGSLAKDSALLDKISPIHKVDKIKAPLMVIHGTNDPRVPIGEAKQIAAALEKRGLPVSLMTFDDEGHGLSKLKNRLVAYPAMVQFLDKHVKR